MNTMAEISNEVIERLTRIEETGKSTHAEVKKTNGRVGVLEKNQSRIITALIAAIFLAIGAGLELLKPLLGLLL